LAEAYRWYVAAALAGLEATASYHLSRAGIAAFSPTGVDKTGAIHRQVKLFPGYVFVELSAPDYEVIDEFRVAEAWVVRRTRGIHSMLPTHAKAPTALPVGFVEDLRVRMSAGDFDANAASDVVRRYAPGEAVPIDSGPWSGWTGEMVQYRKGSLIVLLSLLGAKREVTIPSHQVAGGGSEKSASPRPRTPQYGRRDRQLGGVRGAYA
jgi:transcription antitermination factor NusG